MLWALLFPSLLLPLPHVYTVPSPPLDWGQLSWEMGFTLLGLIPFLPGATTCIAVST